MTQLVVTSSLIIHTGPVIKWRVLWYWRGGLETVKGAEEEVRQGLENVFRFLRLIKSTNTLLKYSIISKKVLTKCNKYFFLKNVMNQ